MKAFETVSILGEEWTIAITTEEQEQRLKYCCGFTDFSTKEIFVPKVEELADDHIPILDLESEQRRILRHEIIHAFLYESGLNGNGGGDESWSTNEEMVDWIAIQYPKINKLFKELRISK